MEKYADYLRCGEIYKSPSHSNKTPYILKCYQCTDIFLLLESFIFHIEDYCKPVQDVKNELTEEEVITPNSVDPLQTRIHNIIDVDDAYVMVKNEPIIDIEYEENLMLDVEPNISTTCTAVVDGADNHRLAGEGSSTDDADEGNGDLDEGDVFEIDDQSESEDETNTFDNNTFVMNFLESQINVIGLITEYKKQLLDDGLKGQKELKEFDNEDYKKLTDQFNIKEHLNLNWQHVKAIIEHLCREYKQYSQSLIQGKEITTNSKASLYFHYLDFLETHKESNIKQIDDHRSSQQVILQIVDVYKEFPNLWNTNLAEYCCKNIRSKALEEMLWHLEMRLNLKISLNSLKKHLRYIHNYFREEKMQRLKNAKAVYKSEAVYKKMFFLAEHVGPFKCSDCQLEIKCPFMLKIHKFGIHGGDMPFTCSVCQKQFRSLNSYVFHARRHMDDINIGCKLCNKKFTHISALKAHMVSHNEEQQRQTSNDNESMTRQKIVRVYSAVSNRKIRTVAANNTQSSTSPTPSNHHECRVCGIVFKMRKSFNQHMKMMHEDNSEET